MFCYESVKSCFEDCPISTYSFLSYKESSTIKTITGISNLPINEEIEILEKK